MGSPSRNLLTNFEGGQARLPDLIVVHQVADILTRRAVTSLLHLMVYKIFKGFREGDVHSCHGVTYRSGTAIDNGKIYQNSLQKRQIS
jgi:hypothetical protein